VYAADKSVWKVPGKSQQLRAAAFDGREYWRRHHLEARQIDFSIGTGIAVFSLGTAGGREYRKRWVELGNERSFETDWSALSAVKKGLKTK